MDSSTDVNAYMPDAARQEKIRTAIDQYNVERPGILKNCYTTATLSMAAYVAVAAVLVIGTFNLDEKHKLVGIVGALAVFGGIKLWGYLMKPIRDHQLTLRYRLFPEIFGFIEDVSYSHGYAPGFIDDINSMKMVRFSSTENDDVIKGIHDGLYFELVEAKLIMGSGKNRQTVFQGVIFHFKLDEPFPGMLYAAKRSNWLQQWVREMFGNDSDMVASGDWAIDETHEFHTDNYAAGKPLVEGPLASALHYLKREWHEGEVRIALRGGECFLLLPSKQDYFALPDIHTDVAYDDVKPMIREMAVLLAVAHPMKKVSVPEGEATSQSPAGDVP